MTPDEYNDLWELDRMIATGTEFPCWFAGMGF
jgi:hypothetical protein